MPDARVDESLQLNRWSIGLITLFLIVALVPFSILVPWIAVLAPGRWSQVSGGPQS